MQQPHDGDALPPSHDVTVQSAPVSVLQRDGLLIISITVVLATIATFKVLQTLASSGAAANEAPVNNESAEREKRKDRAAEAANHPPRESIKIPPSPSPPPPQNNVLVTGGGRGGCGGRGGRGERGSASKPPPRLTSALPGAPPPVPPDARVIDGKVMTAKECKAWFKTAKQKLEEAEEAVVQAKERDNPKALQFAIASRDRRASYFHDVLNKIDQMKEEARSRGQKKDAARGETSDSHHNVSKLTELMTARLEEKVEEEKDAPPTWTEVIEHPFDALWPCGIGGPAMSATRGGDGQNQNEDPAALQKTIKAMEAQLVQERQAAAKAREAAIAAALAKQEVMNQAKVAVEQAKSESLAASQAAEASAKRVKQAATEELRSLSSRFTAASNEVAKAKAAAAEAEAAQDRLKAEHANLQAEHDAKTARDLEDLKAAQAAVPECPLCLDRLDFDEISVHVLVPCGHSMCVTCAVGVIGGPCPTCRQPVNASQRVYI